MSIPRTSTGRSAAVRHANVPQCPLRYGEPCTLCQAFVTGPEDCQTVAIVMDDPELKAQWAKGRSAWARSQRLAKQHQRQSQPRPDILHDPNVPTTTPASVKETRTVQTTERATIIGGLIPGTPRSW